MIIKVLSYLHCSVVGNFHARCLTWIDYQKPEMVMIRIKGTVLSPRRPTGTSSGVNNLWKSRFSTKTQAL